MYAPEKYSSLSVAEQERLDASIQSMLVPVPFLADRIGGLQHVQLPRRDQRVSQHHRSCQQIRASAVSAAFCLSRSAFASLFHMDLLPHIPQSALFDLIKYANMECNATPLSLSAISKQIDDYIPLVTTIGDRSDFSQVILKTLFLIAIVCSRPSFFSLTHSRLQRPAQQLQEQPGLLRAHWQLPSCLVRPREEHQVSVQRRCGSGREHGGAAAHGGIPSRACDSLLSPLEPAKVRLHWCEIAAWSSLHGTARHGQDDVGARRRRRGGRAVLLRRGQRVR